MGAKDIIKTWKMRIYPNEEQKNLIHKTFGCCRFVYNFCLSLQRKEEAMWQIVEEMKQQGYWLENRYKGKFFNKNENIHYLTELKQIYSWLKEPDKNSLQCSIESLANGYDRYYKKQSNHPKYKTGKDREQSYTTKCDYLKRKDGTTYASIRIEGDYIKLPKFKSLIKLNVHDIKHFRKKTHNGYKIATVTVSRDNLNAYYVSIAYHTMIKPREKTNKQVGIDLGIKTLMVLSDGKVYENHKYLSKLLSKITRLEKGLSRKASDSKNYEKNRIKLAKAYRKLANCRKDYLQKITTEIIENYDVICLETLKVSNMIKNRKLSKAISDCGWGLIKTMLKYKAKWYSKTIVEVGTFYASSQLCNKCGYQNKEVKDLKIRLWECPHCHKLHDRDINASINILNQGMKQLA